MSEFVPNNQIRDQLRRRLKERAEQAGEVMLQQIDETIKDGSPNNRSDPGEPPKSQSGELEESMEQLASEQTKNGARVRIGTNLIKAWWLEFGTASMEPRPFMRPAFVEAKPKMIEKFKGMTK